MYTSKPLSATNQLMTQTKPFQLLSDDPRVQKDLEETCRTLKVDERVLQVKEFRDEIKTVREKTSGGTIILVSDGGKLKEPAETTMVLSLETFQQVLARAIKCGVATAIKRRGRPADFLVGLPKVPKSAAKMDWELDLADGVAVEGSDLEI